MNQKPKLRPTLLIQYLAALALIASPVLFAVLDVPFYPTGLSVLGWLAAWYAGAALWHAFIEASD